MKPVINAVYVEPISNFEYVEYERLIGTKHTHLFCNSKNVWYFCNLDIPMGLPKWGLMFDEPRMGAIYDFTPTHEHWLRNTLLQKLE